jgi:hypothetical protein
VREAEFRAEQLMSGGRDEQRRLKADLETLRERRDSFARRIRHLLEQQLELVELLSQCEPSADEPAGQEEHRAGPASHS